MQRLCLTLAMTSMAGLAWGASYHVDSQAGNDENPGTSPDKAWKTLKRAGEQKLGPGDRLLFRAGCTWQGTLTVEAVGEEDKRALVGKYGEGELPCIDGGGARRAVLVMDSSHLTVEDLEITNPGKQDGKTLRSGIDVRWTGKSRKKFPGAADAKPGTRPGHLLLRRLFVHDVSGVVTRRTKPSFYANAGIYVQNSSGIELENLRVEGCRMIDIRGVGCRLICGSRLKKKRGRKGKDALRSDRVAFCNNLIRRTGADGLIVTYARNALVSGNRCYEAGIYGKPGESGTQVLAGIWVGWYTHNSVFEHNEVARTRLWMNDGHAFDVDNECSGTHVFQYNYTHGNEGGVLMVMPSNRGSVIFRYNVSVDDRAKRAPRQGFGIRGPGKVSIYNNTFVNLSSQPFTVKNNKLIQLANNIFYSKIRTNHPGSPTFRNNCFFGPHRGLKDPRKLTADPQLVKVCPPRDGIKHADNYRIRPGSPCRDAGAEIKGNGGRDFWKNPIYAGKPDIGAHEIPVDEPAR